MADLSRFGLDLIAVLYAAIGGAAAAYAWGLASGMGYGLARKGRRLAWAQPVFTAVSAVGVTMLGLAAVTLVLGHPAVTWLLPSCVGLMLLGSSTWMGRAVERRYQRSVTPPA
jgi:hypothetical protein